MSKTSIESRNGTSYAAEVVENILLDKHWSTDRWPRFQFIDQPLVRCLSHMRVPYQNGGEDVAFARGTLRKHLLSYEKIHGTGRHDDHSFIPTGPVYETLVATALHFRLAKERYHMGCMSDQVLIANRVGATLRHQFDHISYPLGIGYITAVKNKGDEIKIALPDFFLTDKNITKIVVEATCSDITNDRSQEDRFRHMRYYRNKMRSMIHLAKAAQECPNPTMDIDSLLFVVPWERGTPQMQALTCLLEECWRTIGRGHGRGEDIDMRSLPHLSYDVLTISPGEEFMRLVRGIKHEVALMLQESQK